MELSSTPVLYGTRRTVDNPRIALVVIDVLVDFFDRQPSLSVQRAPLTAAINTLSRAFRSAGEPVIWIRQEFKPDLSDAFLEMRRLGIKITIQGTEGCRILPELERAPDDVVIVKKRYSAFFRTRLDEILRAMKPSALVLAGINTHACIRATAIDAYQRDYDVIIASECVGSHDEEHHRVTLRYLDGKIARVMSNTGIKEVLLSDVPSNTAMQPSAPPRT
jgi:nicotinamidase-related amidase